MRIWPFIDKMLGKLNIASDFISSHLSKVSIIEILDIGLQGTVYDDLHSLCIREDHAMIPQSLNLRGKHFSSSLHLYNSSLPYPFLEK